MTHFESKDISRELVATSVDGDGWLCAICHELIQFGELAKQLPCNPKNIFHGRCNGFIKIFPAQCADMTLLTLSKHALPCTIVGLRLYGRVTLFHHLTRINSLHRNFILLFIAFLLFI